MRKERSPKQESKETIEKSQIDELKTQLVRALADYDNLQKRIAQESQMLESRLTKRILSRILPSIDMMYDAQKHLQDAGLAMAIASLEESFKSEQIVKIEPNEGDTFNEELHEAIETHEGGTSHTIASCAQVGWRIIDGPVIRHAKVVVFK